MGFTVVAQASNRRVNQFNLAPIAGSDSEAEAVMQDFARKPADFTACTPGSACRVPQAFLN